MKPPPLPPYERSRGLKDGLAALLRGARAEPIFGVPFRPEPRFGALKLLFGEPLRPPLLFRLLLLEGVAAVDEGERRHVDDGDAAPARARARLLDDRLRFGSAPEEVRVPWCEDCLAAGGDG